MATYSRLAILLHSMGDDTLRSAMGMHHGAKCGVCHRAKEYRYLALFLADCTECPHGRRFGCTCATSRRGAVTRFPLAASCARCAVCVQ